MEITDLLPYVGTGAIGILGYFLRETHNQLKDATREIAVLKTDLSAQALHTATEFARKSELQSVEAQLDKFSDALFTKLDRISVRMDERLEVLGDRIDDKLERANTRFEQRISEIAQTVAQKQDKPT